MDSFNNQDESYVNKNLVLPIGMVKAVGPIEDFNITIYNRSGRSYKFKVVGGNICICDVEKGENIQEYEVR